MICHVLDHYFTLEDLISKLITFTLEDLISKVIPPQSAVTPWLAMPGEDVPPIGRP